MKQAKFALTAVAVLAVIGGALAFKANRQVNKFYKYTTANIDGVVTGICDEHQFTTYKSSTVASGGVLITYSVLPTTSVTTCTARIVSGL